MHILNYANQQGVQVYTINQDNMDTVLPQLDYSQDKKQEFRDLVNSGKVITVPEKNINIDGWSGTGYIVLNPDNGTGAYMISGGLSGGLKPIYPFSDEEAFKIGWLLTWFGQADDLLGKYAKGLGFASNLFGWGSLVIGVGDDIIRWHNGTISNDQFIALIGAVHLPSALILGTVTLASGIFSGLPLAMAGLIGAGMIYNKAIMKLRKYILETAYIIYRFLAKKFNMNIEVC